MRLTPRIKIALLAGAVLFLLLAVLLVVLPTILVNRPGVRAAIHDQLGKALGGPVSFEHIQLSLIPRVCATVGAPRLSLPDGVSVQAKDIAVCLKLLPLLRGDFVPGALRAHDPDIRMTMAPFSSASPEAPPPDPRRLLSAAAEALSRLPPGEIEIVDGRLRLVTGPEGNVIDFRKLGLTLGRSGDDLELDVSGESSFCASFSARARLHVGDSTGSARIRLARVQPHIPYALLLPEARLRVLETQADLTLTLAFQGPGRVQAELSGAAPVLTLGLDGRALQLNIDRFAAQAELSDKRMAVALTEFALSSPRALIELSVVVDETARPRIDIGLQGRGDAGGAREFALALLHPIPAVPAVFDIVRGGDIPWITVTLRGDTWSELGRLENLVIRGRLEKGNIRIPPVDLDLDEVYGDALIAGGVLEGTNLRAHREGTHGENGTLRLGLTRAHPLLQLDIFARAQLADLPRFLERTIANDHFRRELKHVQAVSGTAQGLLRLDGTLSGVAAVVEASEIDAGIQYGRLPYPVRFKGGRFFYSDSAVTLRGVDVRVGNSTFSRQNLRLDLAGDMRVEADSPEAVVDLAEMFGLCRGLAPFGFLGSLEGSAAFRNWHLAGSASRLETWKIIAEGTVQKLAAASPTLPGILRLPSAQFDWKEQSIRFSGAGASVGRSDLGAWSGDIEWAGTPRLRLRAATADLGAGELYSFVTRQAPVPSHLEPLAPISGNVTLRNAESRFSLAHGGGVLEEFSAAIDKATITSGRMDPVLSLASGSLRWQGSRLEVRDMDAVFGRSHVRRLRLNADWNPGGMLDAHADTAVVACEELFSGLSILPVMRSLREDVTGLRGTVSVSQPGLRGPLVEPRRWVVDAAAELKDLAIATTVLAAPIEIPSGRLTVSGGEGLESGMRVFHLTATQVHAGPQHATVDGDIRLAPGGTVLDLAITADSLDWSEIEKASDRLTGRRTAASRPVTGRLALRAENFLFDRFRLYPFQAEVRIAPDVTSVAVERAGLCGMVFIGRISFEGPLVDAYVTPVAAVLPLEPVIACLTNERSIATGNFNVEGALHVRARRADITRELAGGLSLVAEDGTIRQSPLFARVFALLNLTELYRGEIPDFTSQGFDYKRSMATLEAKDGKLIVSDWSIDGRTLWMGSRGEIDIATQKIDFTIMVSPFKTIDRLINSIPVVRSILGGRLVAIPMKATGDLEDPQVIPLSPSAVGTSILEMVKRTLMLPIDIVQPLVPGMEEQSSGTITR